MKEESPKTITSRIPATIITGFLGSGKTTFLNHLLDKYSATRFAIIENEFGELGVDKDLLNHENMPVYQLVNGCICCTLNGDFYHALQTIYENHSDIDHLLVETTGIADPGQVIDLFVSNDFINKHFALTGVICLADASRLDKTLLNEPEVAKQLALSDIIMLNKIDLIPGNELPTIKNLVSEVNPLAEIIMATHGQTNGTPVLDTKAYSLSHIEQSTLSFRNIKISLKEMFALPHPYGWNGKYKHNIQAEGFLFNECSDPELFNIWISSFIYFNQSNLYRVKGILYSKENQKRYVFQAVNGSCVFEEGSDWKEGEERFSKIVFIGKYIDRQEIQNKLALLFLKYKCPSALSA
jgi:G3E family GTPase